MSEQNITEGIEHLRAAGQCLEISPRGFYELVTQQRPRSAAQQAADDEIDKLDMAAEPQWVNPRHQEQCGT